MSSGISSALGYFLIGVQDEMGTPASTWYKFRVSAAATFEPDKVIKRYALTDTGRDMSGAYTSVVSSKGTIQTLMHPDGVALPFFLALGSSADSGSAGNFVHALTGADDLPWFSVFRVVGGVITEQMVDCKLNMLTASGVAGEAPTLDWDIFGITNTWETEPDSTLVAADPYKFYEGKGAYLVGGSPLPIHDFKLVINNNLKEYQADDYFLNNIDPGKREITLDYSAHFTGPTDEPKYREFVYGSDVGTTVSTALVSKAHDWKLTRDAHTSIEFVMPQVRTAAVPVNPNPSGEPIDVAVATVVEKPDSDPIATITVKDHIATVGG